MKTYTVRSSDPSKPVLLSRIETLEAAYRYAAHLERWQEKAGLETVRIWVTGEIDDVIDGYEYSCNVTGDA